MKRHWWAMLLGAAALACVLGAAVLFPYNLRAEKAAARREGIPLTYAEIPWKPVPPAQDAARQYEEIRRRRKANDFTPAEEATREKMAERRPLTAHEEAVIRRAFATRRSMLDALHRAAGMPEYAHPKPIPASAARLPSGGYSPAVDAVRMLRDEARVLALDGRFEEAVGVQTLGYNVAGHMFQGPYLIHYLIGGSLQDIACVGLDEILAAAGPDADVARAVRRAVLSAPEPKLSDYLRREVPSQLEHFGMVLSWHDLRGWSVSTSALPPDTLTVRAMSPVLSAAYLHWQRRFIAAAD